MKQSNKFIEAMLDMDIPEAGQDIIWKACKPSSVHACKGSIEIEIPFQAQQKNRFEANLQIAQKVYVLQVRAFGDSIIRATLSFNGNSINDEKNPMLEWDSSLRQEELHVLKVSTGWDILDSHNRKRMHIGTADIPLKHWSDLSNTIRNEFDADIYPDGNIEIPIMSRDVFSQEHMDSMGLGYIERNGIADRCMFSLHAKYDEKFAGTGERFSKMNLSGQTILLENTDALGVNSRRAYKNIPFYVSNRPYGLLIMTSAHTRLSLADISTRAAQAVIEDGNLDLFFIGGGNLETIVHNYKKITGFAKQVPLWSYGTWMSRMTYFSEEETIKIAKRLREEKFPCDLIHLDTGWFKTDWKCEWEFSTERFPDPVTYMKKMKAMGYRISLWQLPSIAEDTLHYESAKINRYIAPKKNSEKATSNFGTVEYGGNIDFSNPQSTLWYKGLLERLLKIGASAIKTDFGEDINMDCNYHSIPSKLLHNLYSLLYQKAAYEITKEVTGQGIIWARAGWTGCQRYPVHWGGDTASTWDGLAGTLRGGLHIGLSGFSFWSHDVPGFFGVMNFMNNWPEDDLYVRWTQFGVFSSHLRYHGASPREPYEYPNIAPIIRKWLNLRYSLIPYLYSQGEVSVKSGYPVLRAMIFHHEDDPNCWNIDDQFYCGRNLLIAPIINSEGVRNIYLPEGLWTDIWTGAVLQGPILLKNQKYPLEKIPVFAKTGSSIQVYPEVVQCTDDMDLSKTIELVFDESYKDFSSSILGEITHL